MNAAAHVGMKAMPASDSTNMIRKALQLVSML
jgi:hypothetical protein